jgi:ketosteroid isomerase-like protein
MRMPPEEIATAQLAIDAWNSLDLEGFLAVWHPEAEWRPAFPKGTEGSGGVFRGHDGIREAWDNVRAAWSEYRVDTETARLVGDDILVLGRIHARGETSDVEIESEWSAVLRFQEGFVVRAWDWLDHRSAREAVGLPD